MKFTKKQIQKSTIQCPYCGSKDLDHLCLDDVKIGVIYKEMFCNECNKEWMVTFILKGVNIE